MAGNRNESGLPQLVVSQICPNFWMENFKSGSNVFQEMATSLPRKLKHEEDRGKIKEKEIKICARCLASGVH